VLLCKVKNGATKQDYWQELIMQDLSPLSLLLSKYGLYVIGGAAEGVIISITTMAVILAGLFWEK